MIRVTMTDGSVRVYNNVFAYHFYSNGKWIELARKKPVSDNVIATVKAEDVSLIEFEQPCRVIPVKKRKRAKA